nr:uncharacterized protein LOC101244949 [Solanum lycopersicum]
MDLDGVVNDNSEVDNDIICDHSNLFVAENQIYNNKETLKEVMRHVGLVEKFSFRVARCNASKASSLNKSSLFKVRKYIAQHTCCVRERIYVRRQGITDVVAVLIMDNYIDPSKVYTPKDVADDMLKLHGVLLTYIQAWRAKEKAVKSIVVVDGVALKCSYGGTMLTASTLDPGGHILPLAYAIVDSENDASWTWFFEQFREAYELDKICVLCQTEMKAYGKDNKFNVLKNFNRNTEDLKMLFFSLAKAYTKQQFNTILGRIDQIDTRIRPYLFDIGYSKWSRTYSNCKRTWTMTSNIAESLNNVNRLARRKVISSTVDLHVVAEGAKKYIVNLNTRMCSCGRFQHYEIPCDHAVAILRYRKLHESDFCSAFYSLKNFKDAYDIPVEPIPCESTWNIPSYISDPKLMPPGPKRAAGRPKLERWKGFTDVKFKKRKSSCSRCHQVGHNRKTCSNYPVQKQ